MLIAMLLAQAVAAPAPDIEIGARVRARSLTIERKGEASLTLHTEPDGGNIVEVEAPEANGRRTIRNVVVDVRAEARIADPSKPAQVEAEVATRQPE